MAILYKNMPHTAQSRREQRLQTAFIAGAVTLVMLVVAGASVAMDSGVLGR